MLSIIFTIYITISLLNLFVVLLDMTLRNLGVLPRIDVFKILNEINDMVEGIEDEKLRNMIANFFDRCLTEPIYAIMMTISLCFFPVLNIFLLKSQYDTLVNGFKGVRD
jgi:hypothetical protein